MISRPHERMNRNFNGRGGDRAEMMENGHMIDKTKIADSPASAGWLAAFGDPPLRTSTASARQ
jgi:hypothetical protein